MKAKTDPQLIDEMTNPPKAWCPVCGKKVNLFRDLDGRGRPSLRKPLRFSYHSGKYWGRPCSQNREQLLGDEP